MHSGYGEIQQFMVDGSLFSPPPNPNPNTTTDIQHKLYHVPHPQQHHHHPHPHPHHHLPTISPQFPHLIHPVPIPITQQLFHHPHHQFQLFHPPPPPPPPHHHPQHHHGLGLDQVSAQTEANPNSPPGPSAVPGPSFLASAMSFKLGFNESSSDGNEDDVMLHGDDASESRLHSWGHRDEDSSAAANIKEPFWRRPFDIDCINQNNKRPSKDKSPEKSKQEAEQVNQETAADSNYKQLFSELEAIYKPGSGGSNNQTGSGSALTGDNNPIIIPDTAPDPTATDNEHRSDTSDGTGDAPVRIKKSSHKGRKRRRKQEQLRSVATFVESLVKQVMTHQESLHQKFLDVMERRDEERSSRDEAWRNQEAARSASDATARAKDRAHAATREAAIVAFLEKITGERVGLPGPLQSHKDDDIQDCNALELYNNNAMAISTNSSRWPKTEVQALIRVRSGFESRFQVPGLKGPLWEEVSTAMGAMGYFRNAKRCKEKWENINKYFRKTKDSGKKRPEHSKTCPYFQQLDQLYSKSGTPPLRSSSDAADVEERKDNSEPLDAIVFSNDREEEREGELEGEGDSQDQDDGRHTEEEMIERDHHQHEEEDPQLDTTSFFFQRLRP